jgi:hypothetical protein
MYFEVHDFRMAQPHYELATEVDPSFPNVDFKKLPNHRSLSFWI